MKFSYDWLKQYIPKVSPAKELAEKLMMRSFEVEEIIPAQPDWSLDIKVLPNRAFDCLSHLGMAREISAIENIDFTEPKILCREDKSLKAKDFLSVHVQEPQLCPRYSARVVLEVSVGDSPEWLKEKLTVCGLRSINNIVDITNYVMLECGQPLHAFDLDKLAQQKIIVRRAKMGEKINTLDEGKSQRILNENILVIADEQNPVAIAGIKGGRGPEIDFKTKKIVLEAANFDSVSIRKSSKSLNLRTDASVRFENGLDNNLTIWALDRAASLTAEIAGGKVAEGIIDVFSIKSEPANTGVAHSYIERLLGVEIKSDDVLNIFKRLGLEKVKTIKKNQEIFYEIIIPSRRADLNTREDLIEEVGRLFGYENIVPKMPHGVLIPVLKGDELLLNEEIRNIMVGLGFAEAYNYSFVGKTDKDFFQFQNLIEVLNPLSQDQQYLRPSLAAGLIKNLKENLKYFHSAAAGLQELKLFELGRIFYQNKQMAFEEQKIGGIIYLKKAKKNQEFYELKGAVETFLGKLTLTNVWEDNHLQDGLPVNWERIFNAKKTSQIKVADEMIGWLGAINRKVLDELEIEGDPVIFEIDLIGLLKMVKNERNYIPPSQYPAVTRDLAVLVGQEVKIEEVLNIIELAGGDLLFDTDLFDLYEGEDLGADKKSLAFHLIFQSQERNLSDAEINKLMGEIIKKAEDNGWEVRK
jgi:phenylalanyl-tRNA synthetase beta chain